MWCWRPSKNRRLDCVATPPRGAASLVPGGGADPRPEGRAEATVSLTVITDAALHGAHLARVPYLLERIGVLLLGRSVGLQLSVRLALPVVLLAWVGRRVR
jgi:hypothetical protein